MAVRFITESGNYVYSLRRCAICQLFAECQERIKWSPRFEWLEPARLGCTAFVSDNEEAMAEKPSVRHGA